MNPKASAKRSGKRAIKDLPVSTEASSAQGGAIISVLNGCTAGKGGGTGGSWYEAVAKALGEAASKQAE
jgi:hypothetical protein